jgi:hypothetical protein
MSLFQTYFELGFRHIFNLRAYDHIVFLLARQQQRSPPNPMQKQEQEPGDSTGGTN